MTPTNTDAAREAALSRAIELCGDEVRRYHMGSLKRSVLGALDAFLAKALEGADEKLAEIAKRCEFVGKHEYMQGTDFEEISYLLTLVTALYAKLKAQKAAHSKLLRDEADTFDSGLEPNDHIGGELAEMLRRLADKIEGDEHPPTCRCEICRAWGV